MSLPRDYLKVAWTYYSYISTSGVIRSDSYDTSSRMTDVVFMKAGTYRLKGTNTYTGNNAINYRIHEYNASGQWQRQVTYFFVTGPGSIDKTFTLDHDSYIRVSMAIKYFIGALTKVS